MLDIEEWKRRVVGGMEILCPACQSSNVAMGACAIGAMTIHQEYVCEDCPYEFTALYGLVACYSGHGSAI